jgi:hypothetical protein
MLYFHIPREMMIKRLPSKTSLKVLGSLRLDIKRSGSAESKLHAMVTDISG